MSDENKKGKTIKDAEGHEFTFEETAESNENDLQVLDVTDAEAKKKDKGKKGDTVTDEERQANFEMD
ncbi:hypothetical protein AHMF7605_23160 [Adhaeribacter arboris]|uniref:Uncharacterized protein n=1 Tax=Adhaeribacter arboris TaxID=2072846 RepID=A0A2T2YL56_9BACT|nr:hypothetical protein [Adhaeribacter arboris]PSR56195.1 hypothetical protein AHMF7605_23160 [Adhaeribacter arboris]